MKITYRRYVYVYVNHHKNLVSAPPLFRVRIVLWLFDRWRYFSIMAVPRWPRKYYSFHEKALISAIFDHDVDITLALANQPTFQEPIYQSYPRLNFAEISETEAKAYFRFHKQDIPRSSMHFSYQRLLYARTAQLQITWKDYASF
jgi:hypothetical protein